MTINRINNTKHINHAKRNGQQQKSLTVRRPHHIVHCGMDKIAIACFILFICFHVWCAVTRVVLQCDVFHIVCCCSCCCPHRVSVVFVSAVTRCATRAHRNANFSVCVCILSVCAHAANFPCLCPYFSRCVRPVIRLASWLKNTCTHVVCLCANFPQMNSTLLLCVLIYQ